MRTTKTVSLILALILALIIILGLSACKSKKAEEAEETPALIESAEPQESDKETEENEAPTPIPSEAPSAKPTATPTPSGKPSATPAPSAKPSPTPAPTPTPTPTPSAAPELTLSDVLSSVQYDVELPKVGTTALSSDLYKSYLFIDYIDGSEALSSDALIGSIAHSLVVLKLPEGVDAAATAESIRTNADPRKWICVEAEKVSVVSSGRFVMLVMSDTATVDAIVANFNYLMSNQA